MFTPSLHLLLAIACLFGILSLGTCIRFGMLAGQVDAKAQSHFASVRSWWILAIALSAAILLGNMGIIALLATVGIVSLWELQKILGWKRVGQATSCIAFGLITFFYFALLCGYVEQMQVFAPVAIVLVFGAVRAWLGLVEDFIQVTAAMIWGMLLFVYCLSHAYFLLLLPGLPDPWVGKLGWFLYLVVLTESNDIAQALIGRKFGRTKITPVTSPNKSLEGLVGGILVTTVLAITLAPWLTDWMQNSSWSGVLPAAFSGVLIATFGFLGDINKSGIKRDVGIKDSGMMIPGQGGMMDRVDSLTFSAPAFFYFVKAVLLLNRQFN